MPGSWKQYPNFLNSLGEIVTEAPLTANVEIVLRCKQEEEGDEHDTDILIYKAYIHQNQRLYRYSSPFFP